MSRIALRLAAIEALCPSLLVSAGPWPTIAGNNVYDSRIELLESDEKLASDLENVPVVIVYTEQDRTSTIDPSVNTPADVRLCHLSVELMIASTGEIEIEQADGTKQTIGAITPPVTDRQHEALLDLLEGQVTRLLGKRDGEDRLASSKLFNQVAMEVRGIDSEPKRSADGATRLAARTVTFQIKMKSEKWPLDLAAGQNAPAGFNLLPEPLRTVANGLDPNSTGYRLCQSLVSLVHVPALRTPLQEVHAFLGMGRTPAVGDGTDSDVQADVAF